MPRPGPKRPPVGAPLSPREREVLRRVAELETNAEIAQGLGIDPETVKAHLQHIYRKLDVPHRRAAVWAVYGWSGGTNPARAARTP